MFRRNAVAVFGWLALVSASGVVAKELTGTIAVDGSSTVYPITAAVAEEFQAVPEFSKVRVTVAYSGTGGGFKKWCKGETDINDASRTIKQEEIDCAKEHQIGYLEIPVAFDGLSVVVSKSNTFLKTITMAELKQIWEPGSKITKWSDLRKEFPAEPIKLYGPGHESGTFDYFTEEVVKKARASRTDHVVTSEDDNILVKGVTASPYALGYFGFAYFQENRDKLKDVAIDAGKGPIEPSAQTILKGTYPLSRRVFMYVSNKSAARPEVQKFIAYYLKQAPKIVQSVGYTPLPDKDYKDALKRFETFTKSKLAE